MTTSTSTGGSRLQRNSIRAASILGIVTLAWLTSAGVAGADTVVAIDSPLDGITPDFSLWGTGVGDTWRRLMAAFWAACLAACTIWVIAASVKMAMANRRGMAGQQVEAKASFMDALTGLGACAGASILIGGVLFAVSG
ncbi:hypothetical protein DFJ75_5024 [Williamsia muralis]|uniref:Uncharacterized protein n=1 Tax=Williamsia marianensis TaxID=85044 RepID=A0A495IUA2_WILMA|nr:hypothetical protein [Williamsia muralis]RKR79881.1 hypothetical protein DFJ75_5024 [Williamsia muralis]